MGCCVSHPRLQLLAPASGQALSWLGRPRQQKGQPAVGTGGRRNRSAGTWKGVQIPVAGNLQGMLPLLETPGQSATVAGGPRECA